MKKRKFKLLTSLTSLVLVVAVMAVGVWAATTQAVAVTSTISFTSDGVNVSLVGNVTNCEEEEEERTQYSDSAVATDPINALDNWEIGALTFKDTNGGVASGDEFVYIELEITNDNPSGGFALNVAITDITAPIAENNVLAKYAVGTTLADVKAAAADAETGTTLVTSTGGISEGIIVEANTTGYIVIAIGIQNITADVASTDVNFSLTFARVS